MAMPGGTRAGRCVLALAAATLAATVTACAPEIDRAQGVQTRIGRIPDVSSTRVTPPTPEHAGSVRVDVDPGTSVADLLAVTDAVAQAAEAEGYDDYRITLREADDDASSLVVDGTLTRDARASAVVTQWQRLRSALVGDVELAHQPGAETIAVSSVGGLLHDVVESARIGYGTATTTWHFADGGSTYVDEGRLGPRDVLLLQQVQRSVASPSLPLAAPDWHETRATQVLLDLPLALSETVPAADMTPAGFGRDAALLVEAALSALDVPGRDLVVRLLGPDGDDVVGWWTSAGPVPAGRDPLHRGWDAWLREVVGQPGRPG